MQDIISKYRLIDKIQDSNVNFLFGAGMSANYIKTVGNIEKLLTDLDHKQDLIPCKKKLVRAFILSRYFKDVIYKNKNLLDITNTEKELKENFKYYEEFFETIHEIILLRNNPILNKQINIFTTNIDLFIEKSLENIGLEVNDGFKGRFQTRYDLSIFKRSIFQNSIHFDNSSEIPVFNIFKIHGSVSWKQERQNEQEICFDVDLKQIDYINKTHEVLINNFPDFDLSDTLFNLIDYINSGSLDGVIDENQVQKFLTDYDQLSIVNPTKRKFQQTVLEQKYYDLLRIYSNELEKTTTILFVMGFSFADEHIRDLTIRIANSNPTLMIYVIAYTDNEAINMKKFFISTKNNNVIIIAPEIVVNKQEQPYTFEHINNNIFIEMLKQLKEKREREKS